MQSRTVWVIIVLLLLGLMACCCVGALVVSVGRYSFAPAFRGVPAPMRIPEWRNMPAIPSVTSVQGRGPVVVREIDLDPIHGVRLESAADLTVIWGDETTLRIEAQENIIDYIEIRENDGVLTLSQRRNVRLNSTRPVRLYLTVPSLAHIATMGSGDITVPDMTDDTIRLELLGSGNIQTGAIQTEELDIQLNGSGDAAITAVQADTVRVTILGSGWVRIHDGEITRQHLSLNGSGSYAGWNVSSREATVAILGSGDAQVRVVEQLSAKLNGSGDLEYIGTPTIQAESLGSGQVRQVQP